MPKIDTNNESPEEEERDYGILTILRIPSITLAALSIAATSMGLGFVSATLEPHLRKVVQLISNFELESFVNVKV